MEPELKPSQGCLACLAAVCVVGLLVAPFGILLAVRSGGDLGRIATSSWLVIGSLVATEVGLLAAVPVACRLSGLPWRTLLALQPAGSLSLANALLGVLGVGFLSDLVASWLARHLAVENSTLRVLGELVTGAHGAGLVALALTMVLLAPLGEETLCRGVLYRAVASRWGAASAVAASAVVFAALHGDPVHSAAVLPVGFYLGELRRRSGSLWPSLVAHAGNNAFALVMARLQVTAMPQPWMTALAAAGLVLAAACLLTIEPLRREVA